ncbi:MAG: ribosome maturation factor RimP [Elusimicrobia bacterium]|nr:ribosome maturation factor RimP [Elusimicrobiota bacterium]
MSSKTEKLRKIAEKIISDAGYEFVDLNFGKRGRNWYIQIFADKEGGITLSDCEKISNLYEFELEKLSEEVPLSNYRLEVSSPGLERPLKKKEDFARFSGRDVRIKLYAPVSGKRNFSGLLEGISPEGIVKLDIPNVGLTEIEFDNIASANLEVKI